MSHMYCIPEYYQKVTKTWTLEKNIIKVMSLRINYSILSVEQILFVTLESTFERIVPLQGPLVAALELATVCLHSCWKSAKTQLQNRVGSSGREP